MKYPFNPEMDKKIAENIKKYREINNLSIEELSVMTDIPEETLNKIENLEACEEINVQEFYRISVVLGININQFFE